MASKSVRRRAQKLDEIKQLATRNQKLVEDNQALKVQLMEMTDQLMSVNIRLRETDMKLSAANASIATTIKDRQLQDALKTRHMSDLAKFRVMSYSISDDVTELDKCGCNFDEKCPNCAGTSNHDNPRCYLCSDAITVSTRPHALKTPRGAKDASSIRLDKFVFLCCKCYPPPAISTSIALSTPPAPPGVSSDILAASEVSPTTPSKREYRI